jgi:succinate dehydrogenase/fumarate reductase cytochrome b subunit
LPPGIIDNKPPTAERSDAMSPSLEKLLIIAVFIVILWNLGAGLYYMMVDKGTTNRTVKSLTWRIAISVVLFALIALGLFTGYIKGHGIYH